MFKTGKKSKIILRIISIILIQAFLFMDVAWCGGTQLLNDITPHKTSTLAPKIYINAQNFQQTFNNFSRQIFANIPVVKQIQYFSNPNPEPNNTLLSKIDLTTNTALKINTAKNRLQGLSKVVKKIDSNLNRVLNYSSFILKSLAATAKFFISMFLRFFKLGFNIPYELGNIASGNWTESQHYDLNQIIKNLIDDADHNLSDNYDHKQLKDDIRNIVNTFDKLPPKLKDELTYRLQATNPEYTLDSLVKDFNSLLDNPNLNLFFLKPKFNEDKFSFLYKDEHGTEIPLHARAHFGHNQTKGKDKEQNCYIAAPFFDSCTNGEKLALIVHELTHLLLGKGDQVHSIAEQIQFAFIRQYDTKADIPKIQKGLVEYIELKEKITHAVSQDDREKAESLYKRWIEVTENLDISDVSVHSISSLIFMSLQKQIAPVLGQIITNLKLAGGDANQRGIIIGSILEDVGITGPLARLIFDIINSMPFSVDSIEYDLENSLLAVSSRLATEIKRVANPEFSQDMNSLIEEVVDEVVGALYEDKVEKEYWRKKILNDVVPNRIDMHIPEHLFRKDLFSENKDLLLATLYTFNHSVCGYGAYSGNFKKLYLSSEINFSEIRSTFKHELIHYLADYKQIKIDINWEFTTYAIDLTDKIMYSKAGDIETAERDMALYIHEYGSGLKELYNRGKELGENDEATYILKPHEVEDTAGYFSIDLLVIEAIKVYQAKGIPTKELRRYLTYKTKANRTIFEEQQFYRDQYAAQRVAGIIMAGIFMAEYEKSGIHPVTSLRNYFHELDQIFGKPSEADQLWIDNTLIPELETLAQQLYGKKTRLEKADVTDKLGLWIFDEVSKWQATIKYWPFTLYPRQRQDKDRKLHQQLARERSIGNLLLSIYRFRYGKDEKLQKQQAELFDNPAFSCLWDTLLIPRAVFQGVPTVQKKINRIVADGEIKQGLQVPELIQKVFHDKYNLGNAQAEQDLFSAYPLHIQYIDSVLYQWSQHKQDPRVKPGSEVSIAVTKTFNAWSKIMFNADQFRNYEDIFELIMQEIWPEYKKLFEQDVEDEKNRNLIEQMEKEELVEPGLMDPDGLSAQQQKMLEDFFNALPQDIQDQIIGQAMQMMNAVSACSGQGSASDMPDAAGQSGKFSSGQMPSQAQPQASASSIEQSIEAVESLIGQVEKMLEGITKQADNIGDEAQSISDQIPTSPGKLSEHGKDKAEQISNMAHELQNSTATLGQLTDQMQQGTGDIKDKSFDLQDSAPPVESATSTAQAATDLDDNTQKLQDKIKQLQDKVNELVKTADRLKDFMQTSDDPSQIDQVGKAVQKDSDEVGKSSQEISSSTQTIQNSLQSLQDQIKSLTQQIKEYEQGISEYKETAKAQQEVDDTQTPSETSVPQHQAGTQAQTGDAQSAQDSIPTTSQQAGDQARKESNQMPSDQPMAEVSSLPDGPTALKQILDNAKQLTDSDEMVDRHEDEEFTTVVDEAWLEALKKKELLAEMQRTGLNKAELKEYKEWRELLSEDLIDNMTDLFRGFIVPQLDVEKIRKKYSGILKKPIKGILGGLPFIKRQEATPLPVKITLLIDVSSSMRGNRILWAKLTMMLLLEVIFAIKDELESLGYPDNPVIIEFELGSFNHGTSLFISHDTSSEIGEDRKERLIYDAIKKLEATGCTDEKKALGEFTTRLIESEDPAGFEDKARRILIAIGDGDVDSIAKDDIRQVIEYALENEIEIFGVSVGDDSSRQSVLDAFSRERAVLPQEQDLSDLPLLVMQKFAECLKPPGADIPWETIINSVFGIFGFGSIFNSYLKPLLNFFNKETEQDKNTAKEEPLRNTEYRHFFYQTIDGKDYLVWRKKDKKGDIQQLKWQRGAGGLYTPELVTVDDDDNEQKILDILQSVYLQEAEYASYSQDGKLYLRYGSKGEVLLMEKDREGSWQKKKEFLPKTQSTNFKEQGSYRIYDQGDLRWRIDSLENIDIELGKDVWFSVVGASKFSQNLYIEYDEATGMYVIFDSVNSRVVIAKKNDKYLDTIYDLAIGNLKPQLEPEGKLIRLIGSQGLGKDVLIRAAAHLANEEVYFVAGNNDMEPEDFREYQTIGLEEEAGTGHLYTATNHVQHNGGWVVYDEWNKIKPKVRSTLKTQIAAKTHQRWVEENAKEKLSTFKNHERARFFATANYDEEGIVSSGISDQALQERYANIRFVWRDPASEKGLQYKLALDEIKKLRPELANNELNEEKQRIREIIDMLVDISWPMRLSYAGYDSTQQQELVKDDFKNWTRLLTDDAFMPATKPGKNLRRAPSPRVLANIIRHAVMYPKTWQHTAWSVVELWFNFYADGMKPQDRARQFKAIKQQFEFPVHTAGSNGIKNEDDLPPLILKESYFKVEDEYLIVTPEKIDGQNSEYWDKIKIWIHPEAREYIKQYGLPEDMRYWLSIGNVSNSWLLYWSLQARSLGKSVILVGEQGTGKSFLSQAIAQLISGPEIEMIEITPDTDKEALTFQAYIRKGKSGYDFGPVARSIAKKKTCVLEESTQGSPGVMGTLNEAIERHFMNMPNGHKLGEEGDGRFGVIHAVNTPGSSAFHVKAFSAEFIERHAVLHVPQLPLQDMKDFIISLATYNNTLVNPRVIGERRLDVASGEIQKLANTDEDKWDGLLGAIQWIRYQKSQNPQDKNLLPRVPGMRTLKNMIKELKSYWQTKAAFYDGDMQQLFLDFFNKHFVLEGSLKQKAAWAHEIKDAFTQARLWSDKEDGLEKYLAGEDMIVQKLPLLRKPDTGEYQLDKILVYLQENTQGVGVAVHIEQLRKLVTDIALASKDWEVLSFSQRLKHMYKLKDIYQILGLIFEHRQGRGYTAHTDENITMMKDIQEGIVQAHALRENWPPSFFEQEGNYEDLEKAWQGEQEEVFSVGSLEIDDILGKIAVNFEDTEYKKEQIVKLKKIIEEKIPGLKNKYLHEIVPQLSLLMAIRGNIYDILKHQAQKELIKGLVGYVDDVVNDSSFPLKAQEMVVFPPNYHECFEKVGMKDITPQDAAKRIEEILAAEGQHAEVVGVFKQYPTLFQELYSWMVLMAIAPAPGMTADEREKFVNSAKTIFALWQRITKSFEQLPEAKDKDVAGDKLSVVEKQIEQIESEVAQLITGLKKSKESGLNKKNLAKYIETLIDECYRTNGDRDAFSQQRIEIIQELTSLTELDLEGVIMEVTDLSTVDHIQLLLKDKTDDSIEHDADVREAVEIGLLLFMAQNKREFLINTLKPKAEECMNTGDDEDSWQKRIAIIKAIANLRDITDLILEGQTLDYVIEEFLRYKTNPSLEVKAEVRAAAEAGLIKFIDRNSRQNLADVIKEQVKKCEKTKGQGDKFFQQRIAIIEALSELEDLEAIGLDDLGAVNYIKIFLFRKRENKFEEDPQVRAAAEAGAIKFVNKNNRKLLADVIKEQIQKCRRSKADDPRTTFQRIKIIEALSELKDLEDIEIDGKPAAEQILQLLEYKTNLANENSDAVRAVAEDSFALFVANNSIKGMKTDVVLASIIKHEILILQAQRSSYPDDFYIRVINETVNSLLKLTDLEKVTIDNGTGRDYILDFLKGIANDNKEKANVRNAAVECLSLLSFIKKKKELGVQVWVAAVKLTQQISEKMQQLDELIAKLPPERQIKRLEEEIEQIKLQIKAKTKTIWDEEKLSKYIKTYAEKCWYSCGEKDTSWSKRAAIIEVFARLKHIGDIKIDGRSDLLNHKENITVDGVSAVDYIAELLKDKTMYNHEEDETVRTMAQEALILLFDNNRRTDLGGVIRETSARYNGAVVDADNKYLPQRRAAVRTLSRLKDLSGIAIDGRTAAEFIKDFLISKRQDTAEVDGQLGMIASVGLELFTAQNKPGLLTLFIEVAVEECRKTKGKKDGSWVYRREWISALSQLKDLGNIKINGEPAVGYIEKLLRDKTDESNELDAHVRAAAEAGLIKFIADNKREELSKLIKEKGKRCRSTKKAGVSGFAPERSAILRVFNQLLDDLEGVDNIDGVPARDYIIKLFKYKASKKNEKSGDVRSIAKISLFADTINKGIAKLRKPSLPQDAAELQRKVAEKQKQIKELKARLPARKKSVKRSQAEKIFREFLNQARLPALVRENNYINETSIEDKLRQTGVFLKPGALKLTEAQKDNFIKACPDELANKEFSDIVTDKTMYYLMQDLYDFKNGVSSGKRSFETAYDTMYYKSAGEKRIRHCLNIINAAIQTDKIGELFELDVEDDQGNALNKNILNVIDEAKTGLREPEIHIAIIAVLKNLSKAIKAKNVAKYANKIEAIEQMVAAAVMAVLETIISETYKKDVEKKVKIIVDLLDAGAGEYLSHSPFQNIYSSSTPGIKSIRDEPPDKRVLYYADIARALARNGLKENKFMFDDTEHIIRLAGKDLLPIESCFDNDEIKDWRNTGWVGNGLVVINFLDALAQTGYAEIDITHYLKYAYEMLESMDGLKAHYSMMEQMLKFFTTLVNLKDEGMSKKLSQTIKIQVDEFIKNVKLSDNASIRIEQRKNQQELEKRFELSLKVIRFLSQPAVQKLIPEANNQIKQLIPVVDDLRGEFALADVLVATKKFIYTLIDAGFADEILVERMFFGLEEVSFIQFLYKYAQCYPLKCGMNQVNPAYTAVLHEGYRHLMEGLYSIVFAWQPEETGKSAVPPGDIEKVIPKLTDKRIAELISMLTPLQVQQLLDKAAPLMPPQGLEPQKATPDIRVAITRQTPFIRKLHSEGLFYGGATGIIEGEYIDKIFEYAKGLEAFALSKEEKALYLLNEYFYKLKYKNEDDQSLLNEAIKVINLLDKKEKINVYLNIVNLFVQIGQPEKVLDINTGISNKDGVIELINSLIPPGTTADIRKRFVLPLNALIKALQAKGMTDKAEELKKVFDSQIQALNLVSVHMNTWMKIYQELGIIEKIPKDEVKKLFELILNSGTAEEKFELKIQLFETMAEVGLIDEIKTWLTKDLASGKTNILEMIEEDIKTQSQQSVDIVKDASLYSRFLAAVSKTEYWTPTQISNLQNQIFTYIKRIDKMRLHAQPIIEFIKFLIASGQADEIINLKNDNGANLIEMAEEGSLESVYELIDVLSQPQAVSKLLTQETIDEYIDLLIKIVLSSAEGYSNNNEEVKGIKTLIRLVKTLARAGLSDKLLTVKDGVGNKDIFELIFEKDPQIQGRVLGEIVQLLYSVTYCGTIKKHAMPKVQEMTPFKKEFISQLRDKGLFFGSARHELSMEELLALLAPLGEDEFTDKMFVHGIIKQYLKRYLLAAKYGINADGKDTFLRKAFWRERTNGQGTLMSLLNIINALIQAGELEKIFTLKSEPEITDTDNPFIFPYLEVVAAGERKWPFDVKMDIVLTVNALVEALKGRKDIFDKIELEEEDILNRLNNIVMSNIIAARAEAVESRSVPKQIEFIRVLAHAGRSKEMDTMAFSLKEMLSKIMPLGMIERTGFLADFIEALVVAGMTDKLAKLKYKPVSPGAGTDEVNIVEWVFGNIMETALNPDNFKQMAKDHAEYAKNASRFLGVVKQTGLLKDEDIKTLIHQIRGTIDNNISIEYVAEPMSEFIYALLNVQRQGKDVSATINEMLDKFLKISSPKNAGKYLPMDLVKACCKLISVLSQLEVTDKIIADVNSKIQQLLSEVIRNLNDDATAIGHIKGLQQDDVIMVVNTLIDSGLFDELRRTWLSLLFDETKKYADYSHSILNDAWDKLMSVIYNLAYYAGPKQNVASSIVKSIDRKGGVEEYLSSITDGKLPPADNIYERSPKRQELKYSPKGTYRAELQIDKMAVFLYDKNGNKIIAETETQVEGDFGLRVSNYIFTNDERFLIVAYGDHFIFFDLERLNNRDKAKTKKIYLKPYVKSINYAIEETIGTAQRLQSTIHYIEITQDDRHLIIGLEDHRKDSDNQVYKCVVPQVFEIKDQEGNYRDEDKLKSDIFVHQLSTHTRPATGLVADSRLSPNDQFLVIRSRDTKSLEIYRLKGEDGTLPIDKGLENFPTKFEFDHDILDFTFTNDSRFLIVAAIIGTKEKLIFYDLSTIVSGPFLPKYAEVPLPPETGLISRIRATPKDNFVAISTMRRAVHFVKIKHKDGRYKTEKELQESLEEKFDITIDELTHSVDDLDFSGDDTTFAFFEGGSLHSYHFPIKEVEKKPKETPQSAKLLKALLYLRQVLLSKETVSTETIEIPDDVVEALWVLSAIKQPQQYIEESLDILSAHYELIKLLIKQSWFEELVKYIEAFQDNLDFGGAGLMSYIAQRDVDKKPVSYINVQKQIEKLRTNIDKLHKEMADKIEELALENINWEQWEGILDYFFRYYSSRLSSGSRSTSIVFKILIKECDFGEKFAKRYGLELPNDYQDERLIEFTYKLYMKFWMAKLFPALARESAELVIFDGYEQQLGEAIEGSIMTGLDYNFMLSLLTDKEREASEIKGNYRPKDKKTALDLKREILGKLRKTNCQTLYATNKPDMTKMRGLVNKYSKDKAKILSKPPKEITAIKTRIAILEERLKSLSAEQQPKKDKESDAKGQLEQKLSKLVRERERLAKDIAVVSLESIKKLIESMKLEQDDVVRNVMKVYLRAFDSYGRCLITYSYPQHNFRQYEFYIPPEVSAIKALRQLLGDDVSNHFKDEDKQKIKDILEELKRQKAEHKKIQKQIEILKTELARIDALRSVDIDVTAGKADELERQLVTNILVEQAI